MNHSTPFSSKHRVLHSLKIFQPNAIFHSKCSIPTVSNDILFINNIGVKYFRICLIFYAKYYSDNGIDSSFLSIASKYHLDIHIANE